MSFCLMMVMMVAPSPALPNIPVPLGHFGTTVEEAPQGGLPAHSELIRIDSCQPQAVYLERFVSGSLRALEQIQFWLNGVPQLERRLFKKPNVLAEVAVLSRNAIFADLTTCQSAVLVDGFKWSDASAPKKLCAAASSATGAREYWGFTEKLTAFGISVKPGAPNPCLLRLSSTLFDKTGAARLRIAGRCLSEN
jgi:hypothetical protein